jgi:hypothetical protein
MPRGVRGAALGHNRIDGLPAAEALVTAVANPKNGKWNVHTNELEVVKI